MKAFVIFIAATAACAGWFCWVAGPALCALGGLRGDWAMIAAGAVLSACGFFFMAAVVFAFARKVPAPIQPSVLELLRAGKARVN
jgi:hypothetical protein